MEMSCFDLIWGFFEKKIRQFLNLENLRILMKSVFWKKNAFICSKGIFNKIAE